MFRCEIAAKRIPAIRAMIARELASQGKTQEEIARILGVSQGAVSQYSNRIRGRKELAENLHIKDICRRILQENSDIEKEICALCCHRKGI